MKLAVVVSRATWPARTRVLLRRMEEEVGAFELVTVAPTGSRARASGILARHRLARALPRLAAAALYQRYTRAIVRAEERVFGPAAEGWQPGAPPEDIGSLADDRAGAWFEAHRPDVCVPIDGGIVGPGMLARCRWVRWHHAIMPDLRGLASPFWAISLNRPDWLGVTVQQLVERIDAGPIFAQQTLRPDRSDDLVSIHVKLDQLVADLLVRTLRGVRDGTAVPRPCDPGRGRYLSSPDLKALFAFPLRQARFRRQFAPRIRPSSSPPAASSPVA